MNEDILINITPQETRVALILQGAVQELHIERTLSRGLAGNIYLGKVVRVLPGMQSAFIDIGLERAAFLHVADIWEAKPHDGQSTPPTPIEKLLYDGQTVTVVGVTRGYPNMMQPGIVMSRDTLRMLGQADTGPRVGPLMIKLKNPAQAAQVAVELNTLGKGQWKAWTRQELADANSSAMFEEGILVIIIGGCVILGIIIGVAITWQTLRGAIMANIKEFASLRALGVGMGSLNLIVVELSFWVGVVGVIAAIFLTWLVSLLAMANAVIIALPFSLLLAVGGGLILIAMGSGLLSLGILKNSQPADLLR